MLRCPAASVSLAKLSATALGSGDSVAFTAPDGWLFAPMLAADGTSASYEVLAVRAADAASAVIGKPSRTADGTVLASGDASGPAISPVLPAPGIYVVQVRADYAGMLGWEFGGHIWLFKISAQ